MHTQSRFTRRYPKIALHNGSTLDEMHDALEMAIEAYRHWLDVGDKNEQAIEAEVMRTIRSMIASKR